MSLPFSKQKIDPRMEYLDMVRGETPIVKEKIKVVDCRGQLCVD